MFLGEQDEHSDLYDRLLAEAGHLTDKPQVSEDLAELQTRWGAMYAASEVRGTAVGKAVEGWAVYRAAVTQVEELIGKFKEKIVVPPVVNSVELETLQSELSLCMVSG